MNNKKSDLLVMILMFGIVSLLADIVYEGARSISGDFIDHLRGPAIAAGLIGAGEIFGYGFRFVSGVLSLKFRSEKVLWTLVIIGYLVQAVFIPLLAFVGSWEIAVLFYFLERLGKGLRTPARDTLLAEATKEVGRGLGFGIHEALDQIGAVVGPFMVGILVSYGGYKPAFLSLALPGVLSMIVLLLIMKKYHIHGSDDHRKNIFKGKELFDRASRRIILYFLLVFFLSSGFIHWSIISYHMSFSIDIQPSTIAYLYGVSMIVDALVAIPIGIAYDRVGLKILVMIPIIALFIPILLSTSSDALHLILIAVMFGVVMSAFETIMRSAIPRFVSKQILTFAYGMYGLVQGVSWFMGSLIVSYLYQRYGEVFGFLYFPVPMILISLVISIIILIDEKYKEL